MNELTNRVSLDRITNAYKYMGYTYFTRGDYNLNIFGIRSKTNKDSNAFNDVIGVSYMVNGIWNFKAYEATTDPGLSMRLHPINKNGTAILVPGQYRAVYKIGLHQNKYEALVQRKPMRYWRDNNCDASLDFHGIIYNEIAGTNLHRATAIKGVTSKIVDDYSAGCQVIASYDRWVELMHLVETAAESYGNSFTYTLFTEDNFFCESTQTV